MNFESVSPVSEEAGFITVCVRAQESQFLERSIVILLNTMQGSASGSCRGLFEHNNYLFFSLTEFNDFLPLNNVPLTISPGIGVNCTNVTLQGDDGVEGTETFSIRMSSDSNGVSFGDDLRIQLIDDDGKELLHALAKDSACNSSKSTLCTLDSSNSLTIAL